MPIRDFVCTVCMAEQERIYEVRDGEKLIPNCNNCRSKSTLEMTANLRTTRLAKTAVFPFTSTHIDQKGTPIVVESMGDVRRLERKYGVCMTGFSNNDNNLDTPKDLPMGRPGGREYQGDSVPWMRR